MAVIAFVDRDPSEKGKDSGPVQVHAEEDFKGPPEGYDIVTHKGTPQVTYSKGEENHPRS
jgi:hypothetical protein